MSENPTSWLRTAERTERQHRDTDHSSTGATEAGIYRSRQDLCHHISSHACVLSWASRFVSRCARCPLLRSFPFPLAPRGNVSRLPHVWQRHGVSVFRLAMAEVDPQWSTWIHPSRISSSLYAQVPLIMGPFRSIHSLRQLFSLSGREHWLFF